jgi:hypothetical protein
MANIMNWIDTLNKKEAEEEIERSKKYNCNGKCYYMDEVCPKVATCPETREAELFSRRITIFFIVIISIILIILIFLLIKDIAVISESMKGIFREDVFIND